jgi:hypothetical protein
MTFASDSYSPLVTFLAGFVLASMYLVFMLVLLPHLVK